MNLAKSRIPVESGRTGGGAKERACCPLASWPQIKSGIRTTAATMEPPGHAPLPASLAPSGPVTVARPQNALPATAMPARSPTTQLSWADGHFIQESWVISNTHTPLQQPTATGGTNPATALARTTPRNAVRHHAFSTPAKQSATAPACPAPPRPAPAPERCPPCGAAPSVRSRCGGAPSARAGSPPSSSAPACSLSTPAAAPCHAPSRPPPPMASPQGPAAAGGPPRTSSSPPPPQSQRPRGPRTSAAPPAAPRLGARPRRPATLGRAPPAEAGAGRGRGGGGGGGGGRGRQRPTRRWPLRWGPQRRCRGWPSQAGRPMARPALPAQGHCPRQPRQRPHRLRRPRPRCSSERPRRPRSTPECTRSCPRPRSRPRCCCPAAHCSARPPSRLVPPHLLLPRTPPPWPLLALCSAHSSPRAGP